MDYKAYLEQITREKGTEYADAVKLAALGQSVMGMIRTCDIEEESQRDDIGNTLTEFLSISMTMLVEAKGWSHAELAAASRKLHSLVRREHPFNYPINVSH